MKTKAAIYARFSSHNQNEMSIHAQIRACKEYATANNIEIVEIYTDEAKSATTANRPNFQRMLKDSNHKKFSILLVHKMDRFSRNKFDAIACKAILEKNDISVISVTEQFDDSPEGCMMETVIEGMAQYYSMNLGREVKKGQLEAALQALFLGGRPPLGYKVVNQSLIIDEFNAKAVKLIFDMYCSGYSYNEIANTLNEKGYKTQFNKDFSKNSIRNILMNERYTGVYIYNQRKSKGKYSGTRNNNSKKNDSEIIRIEGGIPQIITKSQFEETQHRLKEHEHLKGGKKHRYVLSGKVKCGCGGIMCGNTRKSGRNKIQHSYYRCNKCGHEINVLYLDEFVITAIKKFIIYSADKSLSKLTNGLNEYVNNNKCELNNELHSLKMNIDGNNKKIDNLIDRLADIDDTGEKSQAVLNKINNLEKTNELLNRKRKKLEKQLNVKYSKKRVNCAFEALSDYINTYDTINVRRFLANYIKSITVDKDNDTVTVITK